MDYEKSSFFISFFALLANVGMWLWVRWSNRQKATVAEIKGLRDMTSAEIKGLRDMIDHGQKAQDVQCNAHHNRTTTLEVQFANAPTHEHIGAVYDRINDVKGSVDKMAGALGGVEHQLKLLISHHIKNGD